MLKEEELPSHLFSKNKKTNQQLEKHYYKSKIKQERNKLSNYLHNYEPGYMEPEHDG